MPAPQSAAVPEGWSIKGPGVVYRTFGGGRSPLYHVARVDLHDRRIRTFVTGESDRGKTVSDVARRHSAIAAVNGDYFDAELRPIGYTEGPCGEWETRGPRSRRRETALLVGDRRANIAPSPDRAQKPSWADFAISGWPALVEDCRALTSSELPGSDAFTRAPHARTAVGVDRTGRYLFMITASPTQHVRGATLPELAQFMRTELGVCEGMNLDGGGSTAFYAGQARLQPEPQFEERRVANHLVVVPAAEYQGCELPASTTARVDQLPDVGEVLGGRIEQRVLQFEHGSARLERGSLIVLIYLDPARSTTTARALRETGLWRVEAREGRLECRSSGDVIESAHALRQVLDQTHD